MLQKGASSVLENNHLLSADQVTLVIVIYSTTEEEIPVPQGQSMGSSCNPSTEKVCNLLHLMLCSVSL